MPAAGAPAGAPPAAVLCRVGCQAAGSHKAPAAPGWCDGHSTGTPGHLAGSCRREQPNSTTEKQQSTRQSGVNNIL